MALGPFSEGGLALVSYSRRMWRVTVCTMKATDQFALALRIIGVLGIAHVVWTFVRNPAPPTLVLIVRVVSVLICPGRPAAAGTPVLTQHGIRIRPHCKLRLARVRIGYEVYRGLEGLGWLWLRRVTGDNL